MSKVESGNPTTTLPEADNQPIPTSIMDSRVKKLQAHKKRVVAAIIQASKDGDKVKRYERA